MDSVVMGNDLSRQYRSLTINTVICIVRSLTILVCMPTTLEKLKGQIALGLSVLPPVRMSVQKLR